MKKIFTWLFLLFTLAAGIIPVQAQSEQVQSFTSEINLQADSAFTVKETIVYDFGDLYRHGIYRDIPFHYTRTEGNYNVRIIVQGVTDETGSSYNYETSTHNDDLRIKIGDPDVTITGVHTYVISYQVTRAINYFSDHDEFYWNVTGNSWEIPMEKVQAIVSLPSNLDWQEQPIQKDCFTGEAGSSEKKCHISLQSGKLYYRTVQILQPFQGLTILAGLPKDTLQQPDITQQILWFIQDNWAVFIPFIVFFFLLWRWWKSGRDPETHKHIAPMYEAPKGMAAAEVGVVVDERADNKDVSSTVIQLAVKGYLKIREIETTHALVFKGKDYEFIKLKEADADLKEFEKTLMDGIFGSSETKKLSELKDKFYKTMKAIKQDLYSSLTSDGYFPTNPERIRGAYYGVGLLIGISGFWIGSAMESVSAIIALVLTGIAICIFGHIMPRRSPKGVDAYVEILGLKLYLERAEKKQIDFFNAPEKKPEIFEKLLPYAMVLGVEQTWAKEFADLYTEPPSWYEGSHMGAFNSFYLANALNNFSTASASTFVSTPSSAGSGGSGFGGGGFSGGGFGGGGGGSW